MISASFGTKNASTCSSGFKKIAGCHEFLGKQTDRQTAFHIDSNDNACNINFTTVDTVVFSP